MMAQQATLSRGKSWGAGDPESVSAASGTARSRTRLKELEDGVGKSSSEIRRVEAEIRKLSENLEKLLQQQQGRLGECKSAKEEDNGNAQSSSLQNVAGYQVVEAEAGDINGNNQEDVEKKNEVEEVATTTEDGELRRSKSGGREAAAQKTEVLRIQENLNKKRAEMAFLLEQHGTLIDLMNKEKKRIQAAGEMEPEESMQQSAAVHSGMKSVNEDVERLWRLIEGLSDLNAEKHPHSHPDPHQQQLRQTQSLPRQQKPRVYHDISSLRSRYLARNAQNGVRSANLGRSASVGAPSDPSSSPIPSPSPRVSGRGGGGGYTGSGNGGSGKEPPPLGAAEFVERQGSGNRKRQKSSTFELEKEKHREHLRSLSTSRTGSTCSRHFDHEANETEKEKKRTPLDKLSSRTSSSGSTGSNSIGKAAKNGTTRSSPPPPHPPSASTAASVLDAIEDPQGIVSASALSMSSSLTASPSSSLTGSLRSSSSPLQEQQQPSASPASSIGSSEMSAGFGLAAASATVAVADGKSPPDLSPAAFDADISAKMNNGPAADSEIPVRSTPAAGAGLARGEEDPTGQVVEGSGEFLEAPGLMKGVESSGASSSTEEEEPPSPPAEHRVGGDVAKEEVKNEQEQKEEKEKEEEEEKEDGVQMSSDLSPSAAGFENEKKVVSSVSQGMEESPAKSVSSPEDSEEAEDKGVQPRGDDDAGHDEATLSGDESVITTENRPLEEEKTDVQFFASGGEDTPDKSVITTKNRPLEEEKTDVQFFASGGEDMPEPAAPSVVPPMSFSFRDKLLQEANETQGGSEGSPSSVSSVHETLEPPLDVSDDVLQGEPTETAAEGEEEVVPLQNEAIDGIEIAPPAEAEHPSPVVAEGEGAGERVEEGDLSGGEDGGGSFGDREEAAESSTRGEGIGKSYGNLEEEIDIPEGDIEDIEVAETAEDARDSKQLLNALASKAGIGGEAPKEKKPESSSNEGPTEPLDNGTTPVSAETPQPQQNGLKADEADTIELDKFPEEEPQNYGEEAVIAESGEGRNWRQEAEDQMVQLSSQLSLLQKQVEEEVEQQEKSKSDFVKEQTSTDREQVIRQVSSFADEVHGLRQNINEIQGILNREGGDPGVVEHWARDLQSKCADQSAQLEHLGRQVSSMTNDLQQHLKLRADIDDKLEKQVKDRQKTEGQLTGLSEALAYTVSTIEEKEEAVGELVSQQRHLLVDQLREAEKLRNIAEVRVGTLNRQIEQLEMVCDQAQNIQAISTYQDKAVKYGLQALIQLFLLVVVFVTLYSRVAQPLRGSVVPT